LCALNAKNYRDLHELVHKP